MKFIQVFSCNFSPSIFFSQSDLFKNINSKNSERERGGGEYENFVLKWINVAWVLQYISQNYSFFELSGRREEVQLPTINFDNVEIYLLLVCKLQLI